MFLLEYTRKFVLAHELGFSSPIFGDMFLLVGSFLSIVNPCKVFVSYIRRYVLTGASTSTIPPFGCFRLLYSEICSYWKKRKDKTENLKNVFVSYIRRYVLTSNPESKTIGIKNCFRLLYSEICSYYKVTVDGYKKELVDVFVSYIRRYVLTL